MLNKKLEGFCFNSGTEVLEKKGHILAHTVVYLLQARESLLQLQLHVGR